MAIEPNKAFQTLDLRLGRIVRCRLHEQARKPAYKLWLDFGAPPGGLGEKQSSAQLTDLYSAEELTGRLVIAAVNLGSRRIGGFESQVLVLGVPDAAGRVVLLEPERDAPLGARVF
jgi:tRNA-binding protein